MADAMSSDALVGLIKEKRAQVDAFLSAASPRKRRLLNTMIVGGTLAAVLTAAPAAGGQAFTTWLTQALGLTSPSWRILCAAASISSITATVATQLLKSNKVEENVARGQACRAKLEVLEVGLRLGQVDVRQATTEYLKCVEDAAFLDAAQLMLTHGVTIRQVASADRDRWTEMRDALWPGAFSSHDEETADYFERQLELPIVFVAELDGRLIGFLELDFRKYVPSCESSPAPFVEGWYVEPAWQGQGIGRALVDAAAAYARAAGHHEIGSDTEIDNPGSIAAHRALGFEEIERVVYFRRRC